ncbi:spore wall synthesis complex protein [Rugosimonospora acidiphila]|uniref:Spore wall synthesis complex protein n=1 Tax=Rugosimonospora acidiphila TaxID=556531 RepID=A0ABP9SKN4_9ACTN
MPLSEHEQRLFEQIERSLAEDPKFASAVRATDPRFHARRRLLVAGALVVAGLALVVYGVASKSALLGVAGFVVMLIAAAFGLTSLRRAHGTELRAVGGAARRPTRQRRSSLIDRLEERWRQRPEDRR